MNKNAKTVSRRVVLRLARTTVRPLDDRDLTAAAGGVMRMSEESCFEGCGPGQGL